MKFRLHFIKKYPVSCTLIAVIWYLSFFTPPPTGLEQVQFIDKWAHILMYGCMCTAIWTEYARRHNGTDYEKVFFWAWFAPIAMSGVIELLQEYATAGRRSGEWLDLAANATGTTLAAVVGLIFLRLRARR